MTPESNVARAARDRCLKACLVAAATGFAVLLPGVGHAADADADADEGNADDAVTATHRETRLIDTPIAMSTVDAADIVDKGIEDIEELYKAIPGLNYMTAASTYNQITMRGVSPVAGGPSPAAAYLDMVPIGSSRGQYGHLPGSLYDIERVEVLKGPQGTLYGEGALGGVIRYITKAPDPRGLAASARASGEAMDHANGVGHRVEAMVNVPLGDWSALRAAGYSRKKTGLIDALGLRDEEDVDWVGETGLRLKAVLGLNEYIALTGMVDFSRVDVGGPGTAFHCYDEVHADTGVNEVPYYPSPNVDCTGDRDAQFARDPYQTHLTHPHHPNSGYIDSEVYNLAAVWEMPFAELVASYSRFESAWHYDEEAPPHAAFAKAAVERDNCFGALPAGYCAGGGPDDLVGNRYSSQGDWGLRHDTTTRDAFEMRLVSNTDGRFQWALGAYYKTSANDAGSHGRCPSAAPYHGLVEHCARLWLFHPDTPVDVQGTVADWLNSNVFPGSRTHVVNTEESFFGEASYRLGPFEAALGVRAAAIGLDHDVLAPGVNPTGEVQHSFSDQTRRVSPRVTLALRPAADWLIYASASHGFRPGVVNAEYAGLVADVEALGPLPPAAGAIFQEVLDLQVTDGDEAYNFELGAKVSVADGAFNVTTAAYFIDWRDVLVDASATPPAIAGLALPPTLDYAANVGVAESFGLELEIWGRLFNTLSWAVGTNWMPTARVRKPDPGNLALVAEAWTAEIVPGNRLPSSPTTTGHASLGYAFGLAGIDIAIRVDGYWVSSQWRGVDNEWLTPSHQTVDAKLAFGRGNYRFSLYGRNLSDEVVVHERSRIGYQFGRARSIGLEFSYGL